MPGVGVCRRQASIACSLYIYTWHHLCYTAGVTAHHEKVRTLHIVDGLWCNTCRQERMDRARERDEAPVKYIMVTFAIWREDNKFV